MHVSEIQLFQILKFKLGEKEAEALVEFVDLKLKEGGEANLKISASKEDVMNLRGEMKENITSLRSKMKEVIADLRVEMEKRFTEQFKWMFVFTVSQTIAISGIILAVLKYFK